LRVECHAGYKADERPLRFFLNDHAYEIVAIDDQWYSPGASLFRVRADDGNVYILRHDETQDRWFLAAYRKSAPQ
ncbi:MAG TPA: hypothetical protein VFO34_17400, partial [Candidatus Acidoferrales bacterium]|nr:hypothetical protein [Candidatus Acidoferrales bacterium]